MSEPDLTHRLQNYIDAHEALHLEDTQICIVLQDSLNAIENLRNALEDILNAHELKAGDPHYTFHASARYVLDRYR